MMIKATACRPSSGRSISSFSSTAPRTLRSSHTNPSFRPAFDLASSHLSLKRQTNASLLKRSFSLATPPAGNPLTPPPSATPPQQYVSPFGVYKAQTEVPKDGGNIYFYGTKPGDFFGPFSNFSRHEVHMKGKIWPTAEHYYHAMKYEGTPHEKEVREARSPAQAASLGRSRKKPLRKDWEQVKDDLMREVVWAKFNQHADIRKLILSTGECQIVEHTANDSYWGDAGDGTGKNTLGKILVETRNKLREQEKQKEQPAPAK